MLKLFITFLVFEIIYESSVGFDLPFHAFEQDENAILKHYSGQRFNDDTMRMVYFCEQTVAIVELGPGKMLLNCELIEIITTNQIFEVLGEMQLYARPVNITFLEMITLMKQCKILEDSTLASRHRESHKNTSTSNQVEARGIKSPFALLSGIVPGTKWCGTGDIAENYFDLGKEEVTDACCRAHDLCPVKIRANSLKYNLTNTSLYTKSHCKCDDELYRCLKRSKCNTANIVGNIYFNIIRIPCIEDTKNGRRFRGARNDY